MTNDASDDPTLLVSAGDAAPQRVGGRYELLERIGKGGMGAVYRARDTLLGRFVAVKMLLTDIEVSDETKERFFREACTAGQLAHPSIITIYDFVQESTRAFIIMELLEGQSLTSALAGESKMSIDECVDFMRRVCEGLSFAHSHGIVHRDIKPANLFLTSDGQVKVLDFGIARLASSQLTRHGLIVGTPDFMSPEQVQGRTVDQRSDIFSLGAVLYQMLSGRKPFAAKMLPMVLQKVVAEEPAQLDPTAVPAELIKVTGRAMQKSPEARYQQCEEMLADLRRFQRGERDDADASVMPPPGPDRQNIGRYAVIEQIGSDAMGTLYRARDDVLDRDVAIKVMSPEFLSEEGSRQQFQQEARAAAKLQHKNVVTIHELGEIDDQPYIVMELLGGHDLHELIQRSSSLSLGRKLDLVIQLCAGLTFAHDRGIVHRDVKPRNVRVLDDGTVKLLDFGIARLLHSEATHTARSAGARPTWRRSSCRRARSTDEPTSSPSVSCCTSCSVVARRSRRSHRPPWCTRFSTNLPRPSPTWCPIVLVSWTRSWLGRWKRIRSSATLERRTWRAS